MLLNADEMLSPLLPATPSVLFLSFMPLRPHSYPRAPPCSHLGLAPEQSAWADNLPGKREHSRASPSSRDGTVCQPFNWQSRSSLRTSVHSVTNSSWAPAGPNARELEGNNGCVRPEGAHPYVPEAPDLLPHTSPLSSVLHLRRSHPYHLLLPDPVDPASSTAHDITLLSLHLSNPVTTLAPSTWHPQDSSKP